MPPALLRSGGGDAWRPSGAFVLVSAVLGLTVWSFVGGQEQPRAGGLSGWALILGAVANLLRGLVHLYGDYLKPPKGDVIHKRCLRRLVGANAVVGLIWLASSVVVTCTSVRPVPIVGVIWFGGMYVAIVLIASATVSAAEACGCTRGTETIDACPKMEKFRDLVQRSNESSLFAWLEKLLNRKSSPEKVSAFMLLISSTLLLVAVPAFCQVAKDGAGTTFGPPPAISAPPAPKPVESALNPFRSASKTPAPVESEPKKLSELCGEGIEPGEPAPAARARELKALWLGGLGIAGAGAVEAGCPEPAREIPKLDDTWFVVGRCLGSVRSVAIAAPNRPPVMLYQQAARFALAAIGAERFVGASNRQRFGDGDFYVIDLVNGSAVLIRAKSSSGSFGSGTPATGCDQVRDQNVPYATLRPAMVDAWLQFVRSFGWAVPVSDTSRDGLNDHFAFVSDDDQRRVVATGSCPSSKVCSIVHRGEAITGHDGSSVSIEEIMPYAPAPSD